jgi:predicted transcriptional regulator
VPASPAAAIQAALAANPGGATTAAIATAAGISRTAAGKALAELETAGAAARTKGARPGIPDTWRPAVAATASSSPQAAAAAGSPEAAEAAGDPAAENEAGTATAGREPGPDEHQAAEQPPGSPASDDHDGPGGQGTASEPGEDHAAEPGDAGESQQADGASAGDGAGTAPDPAVLAAAGQHTGQIQDAAAAVTSALGAGDLRAALAGIEAIYDQAGQARRTLKAATGGRKAPAARPGALRELVAAHLRDHPGTSFTPHQIGQKLNRSSGAVANALDKLVSLGEAELATEKPRSFRLAANASPQAGQQAGATPTDDGAASGAASEQPVAGAA